ncbi:TetR/AcrR family transcriptional regulator [Salinicoccus sp. HZC-1]|uniref:TetR/AcrR family transcriptional regulator n=1 Tax=Salinicoccus sp. HZC-1 TaxID=3385497 RepID=UPI00398ADAA8
MAKQSKRDMLLEAAISIITEKGSDYLTLDAVAERAHVSKGGLLYHFKNKDALIRGLVEYANEKYHQNISYHYNKDEEETGRWTRAFINATKENRDENSSVTSSMLAAQGINPRLLQPLQDSYQEWQENIKNDGIDSIDATIIRLAIDGLWLSEVFGLDALDEPTRTQVMARLLEYSSNQNKSSD